MAIYTYREDTGYDEQFKAAGDEAATAHAENLLRTGDYGIITKTTRVGGRVIPAGDGQDWRVTVDLEPAEPACTSTEGHDWAEGTSYGSGGGVTYTDTCGHCGLRRTTDTWDHDHVTGDVMETLTYETAGR